MALAKHHEEILEKVEENYRYRRGYPPVYPNSQSIGRSVIVKDRNISKNNSYAQDVNQKH